MVCFHGVSVLIDDCCELPEWQPSTGGILQRPRTSGHAVVATFRLVENAKPGFEIAESGYLYSPP